MRAVWKFPLVGTINVLMPKQAVLLCVKNQDDIPVLYAEVNTSNKDNLENRTVGVFYTGDHIPENASVYLGTIQVRDLVYHFYEILD